MTKKLKLWLINKLGAVSWKAIPLDIQQELLNRWVNNKLDNYFAESFTKSFDSTYTNFKDK